MPPLGDIKSIKQAIQDKDLFPLLNPLTSWDDYFLGMCDAVKNKSKDPKRRVGAVIINPNTNIILATGLNGFPRGVTDSDERMNDPELKDIYMVHGEENAIAAAAREGHPLEGSVLYCNCFVCHKCAKLIVQTGIQEVRVSVHTFMDEFNHHRADKLVHTLTILEEGGVAAIIMGSNN